MKNFILFGVLSVFFTGVVFVYKNYFFSGSLSYIEDYHVEELLDPQYKDIDLNAPLITENQQEWKIDYIYYPENFETEVQEYKAKLERVLLSKNFENKINHMIVELYRDKFEVRGRMKQQTLKLFGVLHIDDFEFISVGIHEFAHYVDLYYLKKKVLKDISEEFYKISWASTKVLLPGQKQQDFVSGYAMSNKYEDFAESFTYYVFHNKDFLLRANDSTSLKMKYDFFAQYVFRGGEFQGTDFSQENFIPDYYRDITKIDYNLEKFLQYGEK